MITIRDGSDQDPFGAGGNPRMAGDSPGAWLPPLLSEPVSTEAASRGSTMLPRSRVRAFSELLRITAGHLAIDQITAPEMRVSAPIAAQTLY
ncbi:hypothetical protein [Streptomyces caniferus]|uniref:hypothetical protein n=1 Tax=Streptomyces caniferus TaxID=285557 RepID=UPI0038020FF8